MPNAALSEAIKEAYASAPSEQIILHTLELRHPAFVNDAGEPVAIRVVRDTSDLWARLESQAPLQAGEHVQFVAMGFELDLPPVDTMPVPETARPSAARHWSSHRAAGLVDSLPTGRCAGHRAARGRDADRSGVGQ